RIRGRPAVSGIAGNSVPCNRGNDPVEIDLANPLGEEVAEEEVARIVQRKGGYKPQLRLGCRPAITDAGVRQGTKWNSGGNRRDHARGGNLADRERAVLFACARGTRDEQIA